MISKDFKGIVKNTLGISMILYAEVCQPFCFDACLLTSKRYQIWLSSSLKMLQSGIFMKYLVNVAFKAMETINSKTDLKSNCSLWPIVCFLNGANHSLC